MKITSRTCICYLFCLIKIIIPYNWLDGLKFANENNPEIILIDIQLPDMDGYEICTKLRHNGLPTNTTIIAVTSYAMGAIEKKQ